MKTIYLLIGPRGSGKTYVGKLIQDKLNITFLNVETFFIRAEKINKKLDEEKFKKVWLKIEKRIDKILTTKKSVAFESIGIFQSFKDFLTRLNLKYQIKLTRIKTPLKLCDERMATRKPGTHAHMTKADIALVNKMSLKEKYKYDLVIDNNKSTDDVIISKFEAFF
jgi:predicted kinase